MSIKETVNADDLLGSYIKYCASPLRTNKEIVEDFDSLTHHPRIKAIGFVQPDMLMLGTNEIIIEHYDEKYFIGKFIIYLTRTEADGYWYIGFNFKNTTRTLKKRVTDPQGKEVVSILHHPHICETTDNPLGIKLGRLCLNNGAYLIGSPLRRGEIPKVVDSLLPILESFHIGDEFMGVDSWPVWEGNDG